MLINENIRVSSKSMNNCKMLNRTQSRMISQSKSVHKQFWRHFFLLCFVFLSLYSFDQCVARYFEMSATVNARRDNIWPTKSIHDHTFLFSLLHSNIQACIGKIGIYRTCIGEQTIYQFYRIFDDFEMIEYLCNFPNVPIGCLSKEIIAQHSAAKTKQMFFFSNFNKKRTHS